MTTSEKVLSIGGIDDYGSAKVFGDYLQNSITTWRKHCNLAPQCNALEISLVLPGMHATFFLAAQ